MRAVVQRVLESSVSVDGEIVGKIGRGINILLGVSDEDTEKDIEYLAEKIANLRIFRDEEEKMNYSVKDIKGEALVISQFTLYGDCRKGRRPSYVKAGNPEKAKDYYEKFIKIMKEKEVPTQGGVFQAMMKVYILNDGPVTLLLDSKKEF
ncbi:MAG: D-aminoacyl-tRNA deacylase [Vulcanimicrobiota bacterium]